MPMDILLIREAQFSSVVSDSATPWTAACQAPLSITNSQSLLQLPSIKLVMPSSHLILCRPLILLPSIFPSIRSFSNESVLHTRWPKYWSLSFSISPSSEYSGLISFDRKLSSKTLLIFILQLMFNLKVTFRNFSGDPVVKNPPANAKDTGFIPGAGTKTPYVARQLNPCATTTEPML